MDFIYVANGAEVARVHKPEAASLIARLGRATADRLRGFLQNLNNPHILGLDAREALFMDDGLVLVEGQEDVVLYSRLLAATHPRLAQRFFGWGVGGADNVPMIAALLRDLGFKRVAAILDANRQHRIADLQAEFPDFHFAAIAADDVRTKAEQPARNSVRGLLDEHGDLRPEFRDHTTRLFQEVAAYIMPLPLPPVVA